MNPLTELEKFISENLSFLFRHSFFQYYRDIYQDKIIEENIEDKYVKYEKDNFTCTTEFDSWLIFQSGTKVTHAIEQIDKELFMLAKDSKNADNYLKLISQRLGDLIEKNREKFKDNILIIDFLQEMRDQIDSKIFRSNSLINSFLWLWPKIDESTSQIKHLFYLLTEKPALVEATEQQFIKAFSNDEVIEGVKWLVTGRNHQISKPSLFYLIDQLLDKGFLEDFRDEIYNSKIRYVFRDSYGKQLSNIGQSKSNTSKTPALKDRIDNIIGRMERFKES